MIEKFTKERFVLIRSFIDVLLVRMVPPMTEFSPPVMTSVMMVMVAFRITKVSICVIMPMAVMSMVPRVSLIHVRAIIVMMMSPMRTMIMSPMIMVTEKRRQILMRMLMIVLISWRRINSIFRMLLIINGMRHHRWMFRTWRILLIKVMIEMRRMVMPTVSRHSSWAISRRRSLRILVAMERSHKTSASKRRDSD